MKGLAFAVFSVAFFLAYADTRLSAQNTYTAADCNRNSVNAVINGPTHTAVDGDTINIPAGSCTWTSGITVPTKIGISIVGNGTQNSDGSTTGASSSCANTTITLGSGIQAFGATPTYGNSTTRLSCMVLQPGSSSALGFKILGTCTSSGCPNLRVDNVTFSGWAGVNHLGESYGITAIGNMFGAIDHNTINGATNNYLQLVELAHANYLGVGSYGDNSWHLSESYGSANFLFIENNLFNTAGCCENEGSAGSQANQGGGRVVVRFNQFVNMDNLNFSMGWHGTESNGRPRSTRAFEYYGNTFNCPVHCDSVAGARGGTGLLWGNTINLAGASLNGFFTLTTYRTQGSIGGWGACDGSSAYDTNDGTTYYSGTISSYNSSTNTIMVSGSPGWSTNQWTANGAPYSVHDITQSNGIEVTGNAANTLTVAAGGGPGSWTPASGDSIQILRATVCIDQAGGRGAGVLYGSTDPATPKSSANDASSPTYLWTNSFVGGKPAFNSGTGIGTDTARVIRNRDFYVESLNQAAQSGSSSPFDGSNNIGVGHGTLANRPTSCTVGVAYWATDQGNWNQSGNGEQGQLYLCSASNTWALYYTPFTYPHPLLTGTGTGAGIGPPTGLQAIVE